MQRRKFLIGTAGTALGSSALVGSGAFTTGTLENREANIDVVHDNRGALRLVDMLPNSDVVGYEDGRLTIDFEAGGADGINTGGVFTLGAWGDDRDPDYWDGGESNEFDFIEPWTAPNAAFGIENRGTQTYDLTIEYEADADPGNAELMIHLYNGGLYDYGMIEIDSSQQSDSIVIDDVYPAKRQFYGSDDPDDGAKRVFVSLKADTTGVDDLSDDLSGTMTITADNARPDPRD